MKKLNLTLFAILVMSISAYSQSWQVGLHGGISAPSLSDNSDNIYTDKFKSTTGFNIGLGVERKFKGWYSIAAELNYVKNGGKRVGPQPVSPEFLTDAAGDNPQIGQLLSSGIPYATFTNTNDLRYIELPVIFRLNAYGKNYRVFFGAGLSANFLVAAKNKTKGTSYLSLEQNGQLIPLQNVFPNELNFENERDIKDDLNTFSANILASIGFGANIEKFGELIVEVRPSYGLSPLQKDETYGKSRIGYVMGLVGLMIYL